jgi:hypothetical protein
MVVASLQTLRDFDYLDGYLAHLPAAMHDTLLFCLASTWLPVDQVMVHYGACEAMGLDERELTRMGEQVSGRIMETFLGTLLRSGRSVGATPTPWMPLRKYGTVCERLLDGGVHRVTELGPKDAMISSSGVPMLRYRYFRVAMVGVFRGVAGMFCKSCFAKELPGTDRECMRVSLRWV